MLSTTILALAICATSALAFVANVFACIDPEAYCCNFYTTTGIGVNCQPATLENIFTLLGENMTDDVNSYGLESPYVSLCYESSGPDMKTPSVGVCCVDTPTSTTPNLNTFDCIPPEELIFRYDSETGMVETGQDEEYENWEYSDDGEDYNHE